MTPSQAEALRAPEVPPSVVREISQSKPEAGDFRERFPEEQPEVSAFIKAQLAGADAGAEGFAQRLASALWAMYVEALDGTELPPIAAGRLDAFAPIARRLLDSLLRRHPDSPFDPEWLIQLPRGAQPHLMGFVIGALRAARFSLPAAQIFEVAVVIFSVAGALEGAAAELARATEVP